ncbi:MAG: tetratricopeptide repeat protein [Candidatus Aminicenantales bacterium]
MKVQKIEILSIVLFSLLSLSNAWAQAGRGTASLSGVVIDDNGNPLPSIKVVIAFGENEQITREAKTNKRGEWAFIGIGTGDWAITASAVGYLPDVKRVYVKEIERNPKVTLMLKKVADVEPSSTQNEVPLEFMEKGNQLFSEQKYDEAITYFEKFLEINPDSYQTYLSIGKCYREKGDIEKTVENFNKVLESAKKDDRLGKEMTAKATAGIGDCYLKKGDYEAAQNLFKQSVEMSPGNEILAFNVGEIYFSYQKMDEAIHYFEQAAQIKRKWSEPYLQLGYAYLNKADHAKAIENFEKFLKLEPDSEKSAIVKNILHTIKK